MKKIVIFFLLAGCESASFNNTEALDKSNMSVNSAGSLNNPPVLSQQELDKLWISNLQSTDIYYWDGFSGSTKKATISTRGSFSTTNNKSVME
ncbi:hypothetical protein SAMN02745150_00358 [Brevinema andersonii]|uniref:Uncharacterized protein n=1 Tax=Brevinema andersonii TaxID=34097 RepID=A0A1I1DBN3_BREAD|nr:hypothetical protein [Brevinema andersonii]SFB70498.1 hypothetical protein SAMN02745150_00358 [Brevinema andersonii]